MRTKLRIDGAGRIVLPRAVREHFRLESGSLLALGIEAEAIILRPETYEATLVEENGLLVHEGAPSGDLAAAVELARERRSRDVAADMG